MHKIIPGVVVVLLTTSSMVSPPTQAQSNCQRYLGQGYCTDYIRTKYNIPWRGDAITWLEKARRAGWNTGSEPKPGAIAVFGNNRWGHVAIVERSLSPNQYVVSEWNWGRQWRDRNCAVTNNFGVRSEATLNLGDRNLLGFIYPR